MLKFHFVPSSSILSIFPPPQFQSSIKFYSSANVFNFDIKRLQRTRSFYSPELQSYQHIRNAVGRILLDRLADVKPSFSRFRRALDYCSQLSPEMLKTLQEKGGIETLLQVDTSQFILDSLQKNYLIDPTLPSVESHMTNNELLPPIPKKHFDLVISNLAMHWVNQLPTLMTQMREHLRPDGLALFSVFGGDTLQELRDSFLVAEQEREGRVSVRVSPMAGVADLGSLLGRAQFSLTTVDIETIVIHYQDMFQLMDDLRGMGEANAALLRGPPLKRSTLHAAASAYQTLYGNEDGTIPATFQVFFLTGWHPSEAQQKPKERGTGEISLKNLDDIENHMCQRQKKDGQDKFSLSELGTPHPIPREE
jgi:NADH dehydrogenase [ubiquinone] 1 alpha subcomplex assembly factor 5